MNAADRLQEIHDEIRDLLEEATELVRDTPEWERARGYWVAHIARALDDDHGYIGGTGATMQGTIDDLLFDGEDGP